MDGAADLVASRLASRLDDMLTLLRALVETESPSSDVGACDRCAEVLAVAGRVILGVPAETVRGKGRVHLRWRLGERTRVGILGHFDTVWPLGTLARRPFTLEGDRASGPGIFDMKAGLVQGLFALAAAGVDDGVEILFTGDEELGSPTSRDLVEDLGRRVDAVLVLEPSADGALKLARKGISMYHVEVEGLPAHAGLEPERGVNALDELARLVLEVEGMASIASGTTVTPTMASAGVAINVVPPSARLDVDVRALSLAEQSRVDLAMRGLRARNERARVTVAGGPDRPPLESSASAALFARVQDLAGRHGLASLAGATVGGGSDGNLTAALGTPTLDGLGAVGGGAHAEDEHIVVPEMTRRALLLALLVRDLLGMEC